jgi:hypothetical protein
MGDRGGEGGEGRGRGAKSTGNSSERERLPGSYSRPRAGALGQWACIYAQRRDPARRGNTKDWCILALHSPLLEKILDLAPNGLASLACLKAGLLALQSRRQVLAPGYQGDLQLWSLDAADGLKRELTHLRLAVAHGRAAARPELEDAMSRIVLEPRAENRPPPPGGACTWGIEVGKNWTHAGPPIHRGGDRTRGARAGHGATGVQQPHAGSSALRGRTSSDAECKPAMPRWRRRGSECARERGRER